MEIKVGQRFIYRQTGSAALHEGTVAEFSPSGRYVRVGFQWMRADQVQEHLVEELPAIANKVVALVQPAAGAAQVGQVGPKARTAKGKAASNGKAGADGANNADAGGTPALPGAQPGSDAAGQGDAQPAAGTPNAGTPDPASN